MTQYLFVTLFDDLVAGVAPHSQILSVILNNQLRDLQGSYRHYGENTSEHYPNVLYFRYYFKLLNLFNR